MRRWLAAVAILAAVPITVVLLFGTGTHRPRKYGIIIPPFPDATSAPSNTAVPTISGTTASGSVLTETHGTWANQPTFYTFQWQDCNSSGLSCVNIGGATSQTYTLVSGDVGSTIRVVETASNPAGSASATSAATAVVTGGSGSLPLGTGASTAQCTGSCTNISYPANGATCGALSSYNCGTGITVDDGSGTCSAGQYSSCAGGKNVTDYIYPGVPGNLVTNDATHPVPLVLVFSDGCTMNGLGKPTSCFDNTNGDVGPYGWTQISAADKFILIVLFANGSGSFYEPTLYNTFHGEDTCGTSGTAFCDQIPEVQGAVAWAEAHYQIDTNRIFAQGGSKGASFADDVMCDTRTESTFAGISSGSSTFQASGNSSSYPPAQADVLYPASFPNGHTCPALLQPGSYTVQTSPAPHPEMQQWWFSAADIGNTTCTNTRGIDGVSNNGCLDGGGNCATGSCIAKPCPGPPSGCWVYGLDQNASLVADPAFGCSTTPTMTTIGTGGVVRTYTGCNSNSFNQTRVQVIDFPAAGCHAWGCNGAYSTTPPYVAGLTWAFFTTGTTTP